MSELIAETDTGRSDAYVSNSCSDNDALRGYLEKIGRVTILTHEEEIELSSKAQGGDAAAFRRLAEANLRFVVHVAKKYAGKGVALRELIAAGNLGLMKAVECYRARKDARFAAYAVWWIRRYVMKTLMNERRVAYVPAHRLPQIALLSQTRAALQDSLGREPTCAEMAARSGIGLQLVVSLQSAAQGAVSLDAPVGRFDGGPEGRLSDLIADDAAEAPSSHCERGDTLLLMRRMLFTLSVRDADIVRRAYGLDTGIPLSNEDVGKLHRISRERVRQIIEESFRRLRCSMAEENLPLSGEDLKSRRRRSALNDVWNEVRLSARNRVPA